MGDSLKLQNRFTAERKVYSGSFRLGVRTDTDDLAGKALEGSGADISALTQEKVAAAFARYAGEIQQKVPLYSAVKVKGRKLYEWARKGISVDLPVKTVTIHRFDLLGYDAPEARFRVECSKGTYVRSLARDIGNDLGVGAVLSALSREAIGSFNLGAAYVWGGEREVREDQVLKSFIAHDRLEEILNGR